MKSNLWFFTPTAFDKNLGGAYNSYANLIRNEDDYLVFCDRDTLFLTHDYHRIISDAVKVNPQYDLYTCLTNRVGNPQQCHDRFISPDPNILNHYAIAKELAHKRRLFVEESKGVISGLLMVLQKKTLTRIGGFTKGLLGVDTVFSRKIIQSGGKIGIMHGLYVFHYYRMHSNISDKSHLK